MRVTQNKIIIIWIGLDWIGLDWIGLDWIGLDWIGLDWIGLDWIGLDAIIFLACVRGEIIFYVFLMILFVYDEFVFYSYSSFCLFLHRQN